MKVCLVSLLALASSAWAKDSTVVNKGSNRNYDRNRNRKLKDLESLLQSQSSSTKSAKSGGCDSNNRGYLLEKALKLEQISETVVRKFGTFFPPENDEYPWQSSWKIAVDGTGAQALEATMPGLKLNDLDGNGYYDKNEMTVSLNTYLDGECVDDDYYDKIVSTKRFGSVCEHGCVNNFSLCLDGAEDDAAELLCNDEFDPCWIGCMDIDAFV